MNITFMWRDWRENMRLVPVWVVFIDSLKDFLSKGFQDRLAYARELGKPVRVILTPGVHLPDSAFVDVEDLEIALKPDVPQEAVVLIQRWLGKEH